MLKLRTTISVLLTLALVTSFCLVAIGSGDNPPTTGTTFTGMDDEAIRLAAGEPEKREMAVHGGKIPGPVLYASGVDRYVKTSYLSEDFETSVPPAGWGSIVTNTGDPDYTWHQGTSYYSGAHAAEVLYDYDQDEWLLSPVMNLSGADPSVVLEFYWMMSWYWGQDPYDNYDMEVWISTDAGSTFPTMLWSEDDAGEFSSYDWYFTSVSLSGYCVSDVVIGFRYVGSDGAQGCFDLVTVWDEESLPGRCCYGDPAAPSCADELQADCEARADFISWDAGINCTDDPCPIPEPGRCCYGDPADPMCVDELEVACLARADYISWDAALNCTDDPCEPFTGPPNDECVNAIDITGTYPVVVDGTTIGATIDCPGDLDWDGVWYKFDIPEGTNIISVDHCNTPEQPPSISALLFTQCSCDEADWIYYSDGYYYDCGDGYTVPYIEWVVEGPTTLWYCEWTGPAKGQMDFHFTLNVVAPSSSPNDDCSNAIAIGDGSYAFNTDADTFDGEGTCLTSPNIWYVYTASCDGQATASLCASSYDTKMAVYDGASCSPLGTELDCNDDYCGVQSQITFTAVNGQQYLIEVGGWSSSTGDGVLDMSCSGGGGAEGDNCSDPIKIELPGDMPWSDLDQYTCGRLDNYPAEDMCYGYGYGNGEDIVYEIDVTSPITIEITMDPKGTTWWMVHIGMNCAPVAGDCFYYFRSTGGDPLTSDPINLPVGTYYMLVDTWPSPACIPDFDLTFAEGIPCEIDCPDGSIAEGEPCGQSPDVVNGGCNSAPPVFTDVVCGDVICGGGWTDGSTRDTDWYMLTLTGNAYVTLTMAAEFDFVFGFIEYNPGSEGSGNCGDITGYISPYVVGEPCDTLSLGDTLTAGLWMIFAAPAGWDNPYCTSGDTTYWLDIACVDLGSSDLTVNPDNVDFGVVPVDATGGTTLEVCADGTADITYTTEVGYVSKGAVVPGPGWYLDAFVQDKPEYNGPQNEVDENVLRQGGDVVGSATAIGSDSYTNTGTTSGYTNDYDEVCPYTGSTAPDVVYSYVCTADDKQIDVDMYGSAYDTKIYIYENSVTPGSPHACNDDYYSDYVSALWDIDITNGNTYYIVVDGYGTDNGDYAIAVDVHDAAPPCVVTCPAGSIDEAEGCGNDTNGGCNSAGFTDIVCGDTFCGSGWADGGSRDTDWYRLELTSAATVTYSGCAQFPFLMFIIDAGTENCADYEILQSITGNPCDTMYLGGDLEAGVYWLWMGGSDFYDYPCANGDTTYWINVDCPEQLNWLSAGAGSTLGAGTCENIPLDYDVTGLAEGVYSATVTFAHNGANADVVVPVTIEVGAAVAIMLDPEPAYAAMIWNVPGMEASIYLGGAWEGDPYDIDQATVLINGVLVPTTFTMVTGHPIMGTALKMDLSLASFLGLYMPSYGTSAEIYTVTGNFTSSGLPFTKDGEFVLVGHLAGDMNLDSRVNIADLTYFVSYLFSGGEAPKVLELADVNASGSINVADLTYLVSYLFNGGQAPQHQ